MSVCALVRSFVVFFVCVCVASLVRFPVFESLVSELLQRWRLQPKLSRHHQSRKFFFFPRLCLISSLALLCSLSRLRLR